MHFGLRSICCSRRWMWQVWAWLVIEAQKDCLRFLGATYKHIVILCTPVHSNLHTNILHISQVYDKPPKGCWPLFQETGKLIFQPPTFQGAMLTTKATSTAETFWGCFDGFDALGHWEWPINNWYQKRTWMNPGIGTIPTWKFWITWHGN